jgi:hypothetical protein
MQTLKTTDKLLNSPPSTAAVLFDAVAGVQVRADVKRPYDTYGTPIKHVGPVLPNFMNTIEDWVMELQRLAAKSIEALVLCSVWRAAKEGEKVNRHAEGQAMDIGGVWWNLRDGITAWGYGSRRREAVALEATLRLHFGTVLGPTSNKAHAKHWHVDTGKEPAITPDELAASKGGVRKVEIVYLQDACSTVHGLKVVQDGLWGPKTEAAVCDVLAELVSSLKPDITAPEVYRAFNVATALVGFGHVEEVG